MPTKSTNIAKLNEMLEARRDTILNQLPADADFDRFRADMQFAFIQQPQLLTCKPESILQAAYDVAHTGLDITSKIQKHGYLIARGTTCCFDLSYHGMIYLAVKLGVVKRVRVGIVKEGDHAEIVQDNEGSDELIYRTTIGNDAPATAYFARFVMEDGQVIISHMSRAQAEYHRDTYAQAKGAGTPWSTAFDAMALKTVIKKPFLRGEIILQDERFKRMLSLDQDDGNAVEMDIPADSSPDAEIQKELLEKGGHYE